MLEAFAGGVASAITFTGTAVAGAANADLAAAAASGNGAQLRVDLQALRDYFYKVTAVRQQFHDSFDPILKKENPYDMACVVTSEIHGVAQALQDTTTAALGASNSMKGAYKAIDDALARHLTAIADTYTAYINVDHQNSSELQAAGDAGAGGVTYGGGTSAAGAGTSGQAAGIVV